MTKREKIIVGLMILSVIYGVYSFFVEPNLKKRQAETVQTDVALDQFVAQIASSLGPSADEEKDAYALAIAERAWDADPFADFEVNLASVEPKEGGGSSEPVRPQMVYSGFLKMGDRNLAIINGSEYENGESVEPTGYVLRQITPTQVVLGSADARTEIVLVIENLE